MILNINEDIVEVEGRFAGLLGRDDEYIAIQFPGRSVYKGPYEGTQYQPSYIAFGKIIRISPDGGIIEAEPLLQVRLRK